MAIRKRPGHACIRRPYLTSHAGGEDVVGPPLSWRAETQVLLLCGILCPPLVNCLRHQRGMRVRSPDGITLSCVFSTSPRRTPMCVHFTASALQLPVLGCISWIGSVEAPSLADYLFEFFYSLQCPSFLTSLRELKETWKYPVLSRRARGSGKDTSDFNLPSDSESTDTPISTISL